MSKRRRIRRIASPFRMKMNWSVLDRPSDPGRARLQDETTVMRLSHLPKPHDMGQRTFKEVRRG